MKKLLAILLCMTLLVGIVPASLADTVIAKAVARVQFNLREEPDKTAEIVANIAIGSELEVIQYSEQWCRIRYRGINGYAMTGWLRMKGEVDLSGADSRLVLDSAAQTATSTDVATPTDAAVPDAGDTYMYECMTLCKFNMRETPDEDARRIKEIKKGGKLLVLSYAEDWCKVQTTDGRTTGYAKTKWLFHYSSVDRFKYEVPGYDQYRMTGYLVMNRDEHITDADNQYGGNDLNAGDIIFVKGTSEADAQILLRRDWTSVPADAATYYPLVDWREAKAGDIIGGYTQFYGQRQGGVYWARRQHNIKQAMARMDNTVIACGEEYSFYANIGPVTTGGGYVVAGITGGSGSGTGGGVCHTSTLMYQAALSLPFLITEREPHTNDGTHYAPLEFDATVGVYSDFRFINTLPYDVLMHAYINNAAGVITVQFECMETVDAEVLATWDGTQLAQWKK